MDGRPLRPGHRRLLHGEYPSRRFVQRSLRVIAVDLHLGHLKGVQADDAHVVPSPRPRTQEALLRRNADHRFLPAGLPAAGKQAQEQKQKDPFNFFKRQDYLL